MHDWGAAKVKVSLLCTDPGHPVNGYLEKWMTHNREIHDIQLARTVSELQGGDFLFLVSCSEIVSAEIRDKYQWSLVLHASPLPHGRGWSPHIWSIVGGADELTISLLEAEGKVDTGRIWGQITFPVPRHALWDEINDELFRREIELIDRAVNHFSTVAPKSQDESVEPAYYRRRTPQDSEINPEKSIAQQFDLLRVCDPDRYPAFFWLRGHKYRLRIEKVDD